jgi:asparagine synthase (glutamine-hydrolysing)
MCGIAGCLDLLGAGRVERPVAAAMTGMLVHRGPDSSGLHVGPDANVALGIRRLKIIDLETGDQPIFNEDGSLVLVCNGEIFNYRELRAELEARGHRFRTRTDVEVLVHLWEERGPACVERLNGQFAFAIWDSREQRLFLARDHFGVNPLYFAVTDDFLLFASEIKAILQHPAAPRRVDLVGLDQVLSLPGLVSPRTIIQGIDSLKSGCWLLASLPEGPGGVGGVEIREYWDLDYPIDPVGGPQAADGYPEEHYVEGLWEIFERSVERRLQADVPVGLFLSGGLDSSLVAATAVRLSNGPPMHSFSIAFDSEEIDETRYQRLMAKTLGCRHHEIHIDADEIASRLREMVWHCESPVKESFNTCSLALAEAARNAGVPVVLGGEGADELFGGYPGYRFDALGTREDDPLDLETAFERELRERLWGDPDLFYEKDQIAFREVKTALYSERVVERFAEVDCLEHPLVDRARLRGRHPLHKRSYLDFKLRLADHLLSEHGDRMVMARSVEGRYPFLDIELVDFARHIPPALKVKDLTEKYVVRKMAQGRVPRQILERPKFGFRAPGSPLLLQRRVEWALDLLSDERIRRQGYFNPGVVERLKRQYAREEFQLNPHLETDLLMVVLTFNLVLDAFQLPDLS